MVKGKMEEPKVKTPSQVRQGKFFAVKLTKMSTENLLDLFEHIIKRSKAKNEFTRSYLREELILRMKNGSEKNMVLKLCELEKAVDEKIEKLSEELADIKMKLTMSQEQTKETFKMVRESLESIKGRIKQKKRATCDPEILKMLDDLKKSIELS
jgi:hypothetical protein